MTIFIVLLSSLYNFVLYRSVTHASQALVLYFPMASDEPFTAQDRNFERNLKSMLMNEDCGGSCVVIDSPPMLNTRTLH